ncbi:MAG: hypothetical protein GXP63_06935 [DPANN group archaeon]|nr:hypothetical protein [DPANN group archaeon]
MDDASFLELQNRAEAIIFAIGKSTELEAIARLVKEKDEKAVKKALESVRERYDRQKSPLMLVEDGSRWKLTVRERYLALVRNIVADTELSRTVIETLAVVAWKNPVKQSDIIKIRTNKAYDHLKELEEMGFITRQKFQRTRIVKLTEKFFRYFELEGNHSIKEVLSARNIKGPEQKTLPSSGPAGERPGSLSSEGEEGNVLETYDEKDGADRATQVKEEETEHLGLLEVVDEPGQETAEKNRDRPAGEGLQELPPAEGTDTEKATDDRKNEGEEDPAAEEEEVTSPDHEKKETPEKTGAKGQDKESRGTEEAGKGGEGQGPDGPAKDPFDEELEESVLERPKGTGGREG